MASKAVVFVAVLAISALAPALAGARITVPPGATEGDQYFEEIPNGGGSGQVNRPGGTEGGGGAGVAATQDLNALGAEGQAAAALANANRPPTAGGGKGSGGAAAVDQPSSSTSGEGGMGAFFPILLVVTALAAIAYGLRRRLTAA
jgi:hypothetical protein